MVSSAGGWRLSRRSGILLHMRALILAGGRATRLHPLTDNVAKAMLPVLGRPFLEHFFAWLRSHELRDVTLLLGHLPQSIPAHFDDGATAEMRLRYVVEDQPLGSGGAIKQLEAELTEPFFVFNGDIFTDLDLTSMAAEHRTGASEVSISLAPVDDPSAFGVVDLGGEDTAGGMAVGEGQRQHGGLWPVRRFVEKPPPEQAPSNLVNAGTWLFEPHALARLPQHEFVMVERGLFPALAAAGLLTGFPWSGYWLDMGSAARYLQLHRDLLSGQTVSPLPLLPWPGGRGLRTQPLIGSAAPGELPTIHIASSLDERVVVGAGSRIGAGCVLSTPVSLGDNVVMQDGAYVGDSVLWDGCRLGPRSDVRGSVLARNCVVGADARLVNCVFGEGVQVLPGLSLRDVTALPGTVLRS